MDRPRIRLVLLALALLAAQSLALLHGFVHLPVHGAGAAGALGARATTPGCSSLPGPASGVDHGGRVGGLASLFGTHADDADCRLLDQLADAGLPLSLWSPAAMPVAGVWTATWRDAALRSLRAAPPGRGPPDFA